VTSIYQRILGNDFAKLHPQIQRRFSFSSEDGIAAIGHGIMDELWHGRLYTLPFLYVGTWRRIMFPERGQNVPFILENYAYRDSFGRETVTWLRTFHTSITRRFDAYMVYSEQRGLIVDYLGSHQHLAVDLEIHPDERGGLHLRSGAQRFYEGGIAFEFPLFFSGIADVHEWYDDAIESFRIDVRVTNTHWGPLFGYHGRFQVEWRDTRELGIPPRIKPLREERRE
jgi:hypothetical protein